MAKQSPEQITLNALIEELKRELLPVLSVPKQYLDEREASRFLGLSIHTLRKWRTNCNPRGPEYFKVQGRVLYNRDDLNGWMQQFKRGNNGGT